MTDSIKELAERLRCEGAISLSNGSTPSYFNCEDDDKDAVIPIPVKLRDDLLDMLDRLAHREDVGQIRPQIESSKTTDGVPRSDPISEMATALTNRIHKDFCNLAHDEMSELHGIIQEELLPFGEKLATAKNALEFVRDGYDNQDVNHVDYRVRVYEVALDAINEISTEANSASEPSQ